MPQPSESSRPAWPSELLIFSASTRRDLAAQLRSAVAEMAAAGEAARTPAAPALHLSQAPAADHRLAIIADDRSDFLAKAERALGHLEDPVRARFNIANRIFYEQSDAYARLRRTALIFPGFGARHPSMVADLCRCFPSVRLWLEELVPAARAAIVDNPLLFSPAGPAAAAAGVAPATSGSDPGDAQPSFADTMGAVLAGNLAMHALLVRVLGLEFDAMVGHSYGENALLAASGMVADHGFMVNLVHRISRGLQTAERSRRRRARGHALLAVPAAVYAALDRAALPSVELALDNCPQQVIISGLPDDLAAVEALVQAQGGAWFRLPDLDQPVHTPLFPISAEQLQRIYADVAITAVDVPVYSCATAHPFPAEPAAIRDLLVAQWSEPVRFRETIEQMYADGIRTFVEVGPGGRLSGFVRDILRSTDALAVASNLESRDTLSQLHTCLAQLFVRGHALNWSRFEAEEREARGEGRGARGERRGARGEERGVGPVAPHVAPAPVIVSPLAHRPSPHSMPLPARQTRRQLTNLVLSQVAEILGLTATDLIDPEQGFFDLGMSSLGAVELVGRLEHALGQPLVQTVAFDYPTPQKLADHLATLLQPAQIPAQFPAQGRPQVRRPALAQDDIAIVGMGCRFPGGIHNPADLWSVLQEGRDAITTVPAGRWPAELDAFLSGADDKARTRCGGFLASIDAFDAAFFGIAPREAEALDPQQRLLLEVTWEALEHAAINPRELAGTATGVFIGISHTDYADRLTPAERLARSGYLAVGNTHSTAAGRLAFTLGLNGPCLAVDTACSSSLVALHLACQSLRLRECDVALVGGVNLLVSPESTIFLSKATALSVDGRCKTFDAAANGYVRAEGCGVVVLKRLDDARDDADAVLAVVRGSAVNHDGRTSGLTVPSGPAQQAVIRRALAAAQVEPAQVACVECHGTGTSLGDPIEVEALGQVFGDAGTRAEPLMLGSLKTNLGHLEAAAGIAGVMKMVLQLQHRQMAPNLHFHTPNPKINWAGLPFRVCTELSPWPAAAHPRLGGVSSFGISGTNAHVILREAPVTPPAETREQRLSGSPAQMDAQILTLSARSPGALEELAERHTAFLSHADSVDLPAVCYTSNVGRSHYDRRCAVVAAGLSEMIEAFGERPAPRPDGAGERRKDRRTRGRPLLAFLCSGQGSQYVGMGRGLLAAEPVFRDTIEACDAVLRPYLSPDFLASALPQGHDLAHGLTSEHPLLDVIYGDKASIDQASIDQTVFTQPALFAVEFALARLWQSWGIEPDFVLGHSIGEYVAACLAGVFSLADALRLVAARGRLMQTLPAGGAMLAVLAAPARVQVMVDERQLALSIAAVNGPASTVLSGPMDAIEQMAGLLGREGVSTTRLTVSHAFHSALMDPILEAFAAVAGTISYAAPQIPLISNRTGARADSSIATPAYWTRQLRETVHFAAGLQTLAAEGCDVLLEIGPKPVLVGMGRHALADPALLWLPSLHPPKDDRRQMLESLAALYTRGADVDWRGFHRHQRRPRVDLPTYPFQRKRFWIDSHFAAEPPLAAAGDMEDAVTTRPAFTLLGDPVDLPEAEGQRRFASCIALADQKWLSGYRFFGRTPLPLSALLLICCRAARTICPAGALSVRGFVLHSPLSLSRRTPVALQTVLTPESDGRYRCRIYGRAQRTQADPGAAGWTLHAEAVVGPAAGGESMVAPAEAPAVGGSGHAREIAPADFYASSQQLGFEYGGPFRVLRQLQVGPGWAAAQVQPPDAGAVPEPPEIVPVALLDGAFQALAALLFQNEAPALRFVSHIAELTLLAPLDHEPPAALAVEIAAPLGEDHGCADGEAARMVLRNAASGAVLAQMNGIGLTVLAADAGREADAAAGILPEPLQDLVDADASAHLSLVTRRIHKLLSNTVGIPRDQLVDEDRPFHQLGIDSLVALHLRNSVQADYRVDIPLIRFIEDLGIAALAAAILKQVVLAPSGGQPGDADAPAPSLALQEAGAWVEGEL